MLRIVDSWKSSANTLRYDSNKLKIQSLRWWVQGSGGREDGFTTRAKAQEEVRRLKKLGVK